jgi:Uma2 family endonuclease
MADPAIPLRLLSVEEYVRLELESPVRHEYVCGAVHALAGTTRRHNRIALNIARYLADAVQDVPCRVSMETVRLRARQDVHYYPDVMVACGPEPEDPYIEDAPCLVVEVLSPSTARTDRGEKLFFYRQMPSLHAYLIVDAERVQVERHRCTPDGEWQAEIHTSGALPIPCPESELPVGAIYAGAGLDG